MAENETPPLKKAFIAAESCDTVMQDVSACLQQALTLLPESATELREEVTKVFIETEDLIDRWGKLSYDIYHLSVKEQALGSTSGAPAEVDALMKLISRIDARRQSKQRTEKQE